MYLRGYSRLGKPFEKSLRLIRYSRCISCLYACLPRMLGDILRLYFLILPSCAGEYMLYFRKSPLGDGGDLTEPCARGNGSGLAGIIPRNHNIRALPEKH